MMKVFPIQLIICFVIYCNRNERNICRFYVLKIYIYICQIPFFKWQQEYFQLQQGRNVDNVICLPEKEKKKREELEICITRIINKYT